MACQLGRRLVASLTFVVSFAIEPAEQSVGTGAEGTSALNSMAASFSRRLQDSSSVRPTVDEVDSVIFSRPPHSAEKTSSIVYVSTAAIYVLCAIVMLVAVNLDSSERRKRRQRATVPEESVPCAISEQYYLDDDLIKLRSSQDFEARKARKHFFSFLLHYGVLFPDMLARQHLGLSLLVQAIPTFTRLKRGLLIVVHIHLCMLTSSIAYNVFEHDKPSGRYEMMSCDGKMLADDCTATLPMSLLAATVAYPIFRFMACRQMRLTCFTSQSHPSSSQFPLNVRKFAKIPAKSAWESIFCMRNRYERRQVQVLQSRSFAHRVVQMLWRTTQPSVKDLRFYSVITSWCIMLLMLFFTVFTLFYIFMYTAYLDDDIVYHWLAWGLTMYFSTVFILEPGQIFLVEVVWNAFVATLAQRWRFGAHALACTTRYKGVVREVEDKFIRKVRVVAIHRLVRWWRAVYEMGKQIKEQTDKGSGSKNKGAIQKKSIYDFEKKYAKMRKWCLRVEVKRCYDLVPVHSEDLMSPFIQLSCDIGNPIKLKTKVQYDAHKKATFNEIFLMDIKEARALDVTVFSELSPSIADEIGKAKYEFSQIKTSDREKPEGTNIKVTIKSPSRMNKVTGYVELNIKFLDPTKEPPGDTGSEDTAWMLPKHRMQFALSKMGNVKMSKMLGGLGAPMTMTDSRTGGPLKLEGWQVGGQAGTYSLDKSSEPSPHSSYRSAFLGAGATVAPGMTALAADIAPYTAAAANTAAYTAARSAISTAPPLPPPSDAPQDYSPPGFVP
jgi:hypothetical protein